MANVYVRSAAAGTGTGADWTNAFTTLAAAFTAKAAGDTFYVSEDHAETQASAMTNTSKGAAGTPCLVYCVNHAGSVPPVAADLRTTATISTTGANTITNRGTAYCYGITFQAGSTTSVASINVSDTGVWEYEACRFKLNNTGSTSRINLGSGGATCATVWNNTVTEFGATGQGIVGNGTALVWVNTTSAIAGTVPTTLFLSQSAAMSNVVCDGVDLSAAGSGKTLFANPTFPVTILLKNCNLGASVTIAATPTSASAGQVVLVGSGTTTNVRRDEIYHYLGTLTTETTIKRTAGSSDGTTAYSWKVVTTANAKRTFPFETFEGSIWNASLTSKTLTFHCVTDNVTLQDADIWVEVEYLASGSTPVTTLISSAPATQLTTGANLTTDTEAWTTTGLVTPVKQKFSVTFTPAMAGPIRWKVKVGLATTTVYVDANPDLT